MITSVMWCLICQKNGKVFGSLFDACHRMQEIQFQSPAYEFQNFLKEGLKNNHSARVTAPHKAVMPGRENACWLFWALKNLDKYKILV